MKRFENINSLVRKLKKDEKKSNKKYYYRGQIHDWPIKSSASRVSYDEMEMEKTDFFVECFLQNPALDFKNDMESIQKCYAIAQHYGYKTDLIDFTTSPEVAAYFATDGANQHSDFDFGYIWRISEEEINTIKLLIEQLVLLLYMTDLDDVQKKSLSLLKSMDYNPFFSITIPRLSRMNNQKGVFLWDLFGIVVEGYFKDRKPDFEFRHKFDVYSSNTLSSELIYPKPNALELEIERFKSVEAMKEFHESELMNWLKNSNNTSVLRIENKNSEIARYIQDNDWPDEFGVLKDDFESSISQIQTIPIENLFDFKSNIIDIINFNRRNISTGNRKHIHIEDKDISSVINEVIDTLIYYNYNDEEIYLVIDKINEHYKEFKEEKGENLDRKAVFACEDKIYIGMRDKLGVQSYAYIPLSIITNKKEQLLKLLNKEVPDSVKRLFEENKEWEFFLDLHRHPRKLFDFNEIKQIFLNYILPYQFFVRDRKYRIYDPTFLDIFGPE